ncbi:MAG: hypothetical protein NVS4B2_19120 [Chloroflexota bacterium]
MERQRLALFVGAGAWFIVLTLIGIVLNGAIRTSNDFEEMVNLSRALWHHQNPYDVAHELWVGPLPGLPFRAHHPTPLPPSLGVLALPLLALPFEVAQWVWVILQAVCLPLTLVFLGRATRLPLSPARALVLAGVLMLLPVAAFNLTETTLLQLALVAAALACAQRSRFGRFGVLLALAIAVKPFLFPLALLLFRSRRSMLSALLTGSGFIFPVALWSGLAVFAGYVHALPVVSTVYRSAAMNLSLGSLPWRVFSGTGSPNPYLAGVTAPPVVHIPALAGLLSPALVAAVALQIGVLAWRTRDIRVAAVLLVFASLLCSPIVWSIYLVMLIVPVFVVTERVRHGTIPRQRAIVLFGAVGLAWLPLSVWSEIAATASGGALDHVPVRLSPLWALLTLVPTGAVLLELFGIQRVARPSVDGTGQEAGAGFPNKRDAGDDGRVAPLAVGGHDPVLPG